MSEKQNFNQKQNINVNEGQSTITATSAKDLNKHHRLDSIVRFARDAIYSTTLDSTVITWNNSAEKIYGYSAEEVIGKKLTGYTIPKSELNKFNSMCKKIISGKAVMPFETLRTTKSGKVINVHISASPLMDKDNKIVGMSVIANDITDRKRIERAYQESQIKYRYLSEISSDFGYEIKINNEGNQTYTWVTEAFSKITGHPSKSFSKYEDWVDAEHIDLLRNRLKDLKNKIGSYDVIQYKITTKNGESRWVADTAVAIHDKNLDKANECCVIYGSVKDITEEKNLELRRDEFIGMASHELKTPLTTIKVFLELMNEHAQNNPEISYINTKLKQEVDRLVFLINNMLDVSKFHAKKIFLDLTQFEISDLINETVRVFQISNKTHQFKIIKEAKIEICADRFRIQQVLQNILSNAVKYSPFNKTINISSEIINDDLIVSIEDFGIGIGSEHKEKIFERFYRVHGANEKTFSGLGIGLYICNEIIKQHNGKIWCKSQKGKGTTFYFSLPIKSSKLCQ